MIAPTREAWLIAGIEALRPLFAETSTELPADIRVSCGFPGGKSFRKVIGQCWPTKAGDGVPHVFISPTLAAPVDVLATLAHELIHAWDDCKSGHKAAFGNVARAIGLEGKMTATTAGADLVAKLTAIAEALGEYPHKAINLGAGDVKKQTTRMRKVTCPTDGYTARTTAKWLEVGLPSCPCGAQMEEAAA